MNEGYAILRRFYERFDAYGLGCILVDEGLYPADRQDQAAAHVRNALNPNQPREFLHVSECMALMRVTGIHAMHEYQNRVLGYDTLVPLGDRVIVERHQAEIRRLRELLESKEALLNSALGGGEPEGSPGAIPRFADGSLGGEG